jgi:hypothetical protein
MEQRSLRLGDIVDDYCPRERRVTNHVVVAIVDDSIRQTRCTTCDADHEYKEARMPRRKPLNDGEVPDLAGGVLVTPKPANGAATDVVLEGAAEAAAAASAGPNGAVSETPEAAPETTPDEPVHDGWLANRPLIRASLPKTEHDVPVPRAIPEFTMHQRPGRGFGGRGGGYRQGFQGHGGGNGHGNLPPGREGEGPDGNRAPRPGGGGGKSRHRRRHRRPR